MKINYIVKYFYIVTVLSTLLFAFNTPLHLSSKEKDFINSHRFICIATGSWEPFNVLKNNKLEGIAVDYWNFIKAKLNLKDKCKIAKNFDEVLNSIKNKRADIVFAIGKTKDREKYAIFSKPYSTFPIVIATRNDVGFIAQMSYLKDKVIAVGRNYTATQLLKEYYPDFHLLEVKDIDTALRAVSAGKAYAAIDILPVISYNINKYSYANLKISGKTPWRFDVRIMVRKDLRELIPLINRAIDSIPKEKKEIIYKKWISVHYQQGIDPKTAFLLLGIVSIVLVLITGWAIYLKKEIAKRKLLEDELQKLATVDRLTGVYNRYKMDLSLDEQIEIAKRYKRALSVIFFDIDFFKKVNDTYGHKVGDEVLKELAYLVSNHLRKSDIFGRWGGEEFLIILPETTKKEAHKLAEKLRNYIQLHKFNKIDKLTCSFGITTLKEKDNSKTVLSRVDKRLYKAKQNGRNRVEVE